MRTMRFLSIAVIAAMSWTGCQKHDPQPRYPDDSGSQGGQGGDQGGQETALTLHERTDWKVNYLGRGIYTADGSGDCIERFTFTYTGNAYFIVRFLTPDDLAAVYAGKLEDFIQDQVTALVNANENFYEDTYNVFDASLRGEVDFNMLIHADYTGYLVEVGKDGKATGNYAKASFTVLEEDPTEDFARWCGYWHVSDGYVSYDITVSGAEANWLYYIDGWETGPAVSEQMDMERDWIYARYRNKDKNLYFYGQYLMSYYEESLGTDVDEMFVGTYLTSTSDKNGEVDVEGADAQYDIAHTEGNGDAVTIVPESFTFDNGFAATYHSMRYSRYCYDEQNWAHYNNSGVPSLPLTMTRLPETKASAPVVRTATKATVRRYQPKRHVEQKARAFRQ